MDYSIFIVVGLVCIAIGIFIGVKYLQRKGIISKEDVLIIARYFDLGLNIIKELKLEKEDKILFIGNLVNDSIEYVIAVFDNEEDINNLAEEAYMFVVDKCIAFNIELNENRINIIKTLINIGLKKALNV
jgi:hypothetical protein